MSDDSKVISVTEMNPVDYYNINHVQEAFELMLKVKGVKAVSIDALTVYQNKGDNDKRMIVIEDEHFVVKMKNALNLEVGMAYTPFMLLQKFKFRDSFNAAVSYVIYELMGNEYPYIRVGTKYFKKIIKVDRYGITRTELVYWDKITISEDYPKSIFENIQKYDDFTINPDNKSHDPVIGDNYNLYSPFEHEPCNEYEYDQEIGWYWIKTLIEHIFGDQYELGITYLKVLYDHPKQSLPILVLISEERSTGKTTFVDFLNILFGANMVLINPQDISNQFNGSYADKNIIAIEESRFDNIQATEKLKNLATQKEILVNSKNIRQYSIPFYGKLIITSNDETKFSNVESPEIRYWVRKVPTLNGKANHSILRDLKNEIPQFLYYLNTLHAVDTTKSRMVFDAAEIVTKELMIVKAESRTGLHKDLELHLDAFALQNTNVREFKFIAKQVKEMFFSKTEKYEINFINRVLKNEFKLEVGKMQRFIPFEENYSNMQNKVSGTPFIYKNKYYNLKIEENGAEQTSKATTEGVPYEAAVLNTGTEGNNY
jgi:hypothetical protein